MALEIGLKVDEITEAPKAGEALLDDAKTEALLGRKNEADHNLAVDELTDGIKDDLQAIQAGAENSAVKRGKIKEVFEKKFKLGFRRETVGNEKEAKVGIISITGTDGEKTFSFKKTDGVTLENMFNTILDNIAEKIGNMDPNEKDEFKVVVGAITEKIPSPENQISPPENQIPSTPEKKSRRSGIGDFFKNKRGSLKLWAYNMSISDNKWLKGIGAGIYGFTKGTVGKNIQETGIKITEFASGIFGDGVKKTPEQLQKEAQELAALEAQEAQEGVTLETKEVPKTDSSTSTTNKEATVS